MDHKKLAELLFPDIDKTPAYYEKFFPERVLPEGACVTRLGPSPTGFIHLGNLYGAFVDERLAHQSGGIFYLRIEDTDEKRLVEGAVDIVTDALEFFGIRFDEGAGKDGEKGSYGPYFQSARKEIYQCFAKYLVEKGDAYPCFMTEDDISRIRRRQEENKETPGIYGEYALCRDLSFDDIKEKIDTEAAYVLRLRSGGISGENARYITVEDGIRGTLTLPENYQDIVILKAGGMPTYHFAHVCDDHLMRTTHVIRGEEWLSSLPVHVELFEKLGFRLPVFCHTAQLMKLDENGSKRKLSKRKDPELSLGFYKKQGYHPDAVKEYLMTLLNSDFEEWRASEPNAPLEDFSFSLKKMNNSGALFDIDKLNDISKERLARIPAADLYLFMRNWAEEFSPDAHKALKDSTAYTEAIIDIGRNDPKPRKDFICASQMFDSIKYFFDDFFTIDDTLPGETSAEEASAILSGYLETYDHSDDQSTWFGKIRDIARELGYAAKPKDFKKEPERYKGHVGHVSTVIRIAVTGRSQSPDIWTIQQILGREKTEARIRSMIALLGNTSACCRKMS